jgi:hypothetical protein
MPFWSVIASFQPRLCLQATDVGWLVLHALHMQMIPLAHPLHRKD